MSAFLHSGPLCTGTISHLFVLKFFGNNNFRSPIAIPLPLFSCKVEKLEQVPNLLLIKSTASIKERAAGKLIKQRLVTPPAAPGRVRFGFASSSCFAVGYWGGTRCCSAFRKFTNTLTMTNRMQCAWIVEEQLKVFLERIFLEGDKSFHHYWDRSCSKTPEAAADWKSAKD